MTEEITAVYERGALYPLEPLNLRERQKVRIQVITEETTEEVEVPEEIRDSKTEADKVEAVIQQLIAKGVLQPKPKGPIPPPPVSAEERRALADRLGRAPGKPASEMVIEDRGEW